MSTRTKIIIGAVALVAAFLIWRRRAQAMQVYGQTAATPSPYSAISALQTNVQQLPGLATHAAIEKIGSLLPPVVGQGVNAIIPQSSTGGSWNQNAQTLEQLAKLPFVGKYLDQAAKDTRAIANSVNYNPAAGYYG